MFKAKKIELADDEILITKTFSYRVSGSSSIIFLNQRKRNVNFIWNYLNEAAYEQLRKYNAWMSQSDLQDATSGFSFIRGKAALEFLGFNFHLHSQTVQAVAHKYYDARKNNKSHKTIAQLNWRKRKDRGWIPFRVRKEDFLSETKNGKTKHFIRHLGRKIQFKKHRDLPENYKLCQSEFTQDNKENWYVNFTVSYVDLIKKDFINRLALT